MISLWIIRSEFDPYIMTEKGVVMEDLLYKLEYDQVIIIIYLY